MNPYEDFDDEDFDDGGFDDEYFDDEDLEHEMSPAEDNDEKPEIIQTKEEDRKDYDHLTEEEQVAIALQESLNIESRAAPTPPQSPPPSGSSSSKPEIIQTEEEDRKGKKVMDYDHLTEEEQVAIALQEILNIKSRAAPTPPQSPPPSGSSSSKPEIIQTEEEDRKGKKVMDYDYEQLREDEELARALQESLNIESRAAPTPPRSPPPSGSSSSKPEIIQTKEEDHNGKKLIDYDYDQLREDEELARALQESLNIESRAAPTPSSHWFDHISTPPQYLPPIGSSSQRYDRISTPPQYLPPIGSSSQRRTCAKCGWDIGQGCQVCHKSICDFEIPKDADGMIEGRSHKLCPLHEHELTPMCCSCERMEPRDAKYTDLNDGRKICGDCFDISIMDTYACQPLYIEIQEFYEELKIKAKHQIPLLMVQMQALNEAVQGEITPHHHLPGTRGVCISEERTVPTILSRPTIGLENQITDVITEPYKLVRHCNVTAILILFGFPRLLTGSIIAHELMHAWLRINSYMNLIPEIEEGMCQVLAHKWLESKLTSSSSTGTLSEFERKLAEFYKYKIESDPSAVYGEGFKKAKEAVARFGLKATLDLVTLTGTIP